MFQGAFPRMPEVELGDWVEDYFRTPSGDTHRYALLLANEQDQLVATTLFDQTRLEYGGRLLQGIYIIERAVSPEYRDLGLGRKMAAEILTRFHPDILMTTCTQSASLHSWISAVRRTRSAGLEVFPCCENQIPRPFPIENFDFAVSAFRQLYRGVVNNDLEEIDRAVAGLSGFLVRKGVYTERYDSRPWITAGNKDLLAEALGAGPGDGILLVILRKGLERHSRGGGNPVPPADGMAGFFATLALLQSHLDRVRANLPAVDRTLSQFGHLSLLEYLKKFPITAAPPFQSREPLLDAVYRYATPLLGAAIAKRAAEDLAARPLVMTASHHGVDYYAQTLQSRLIFSLGAAGGSSPAKTVPVFACGNIPLNNLTYPRGLLFYLTSSEALDALPCRLPLFPDRLKRTMVSLAPTCDAGMIGKALARLDTMVREGSVRSEVALAARTLLQQEYSCGALVNLPGYSPQAVVLNHRIWKKLFAEGLDPPEMIYLELEQIVFALLGLDLTDPSSLTRLVLFDKALRENVLAELDGLRGCWNRDLLGRRSVGMPWDEAYPGAGGHCGTAFFWGVDPGGRRISLELQTAASGRTLLHGMADQGKILEIPWTPREIADALQNRSLVPSLFTSFLVIAFARGFSCIGGYFQGEYLPAMQRGLAAALGRTGGYDDAAQAVLQVPTSLYLDGMSAVLSRTEEGGLIPAGPLEIMAGGGLTGEDLGKMGSLTVEEAHLADLFETIPDAIPPESRTAGWQRELVAACSRLLQEKVVIK